MSKVVIYDIIYFKRLKNNNYLVDDGLRDTDETFRDYIDLRLEDMFLTIKNMRTKVKIVEI